MMQRMRSDWTPAPFFAMWNFIIDSARQGLMNMAIDEALLLTTENSVGPFHTTVRIYKWAAPTLSIGYGQKPAQAANLKFCREHKIEIVRRPTGGRAVLHDKELTYSVVSNDPRYFNLKSSTEIYMKISQALRLALEQFGLPLTNGSSFQGRNPMNQLSGNNYLKVRRPCFTSLAKHELLCRGKKIIASAQKRLRASFLQHGSLLLDCDFGLLAATTGSDETVLRERITSLSNETQTAISEEALTRRLQKAFEEVFHARLVESELDEGVWQLATHREGNYSIG